MTNVNEIGENRDEDQEEELDLDYIDVEEEDDFKNRPAPKCSDLFLNSLCGDSDAYVGGLDVSDEEEFDSSDIEDDEHSHLSGDEGGVGVDFCTHDPSVKWNKMKPRPGERYESVAQLKHCVRNYGISQGYNLRFHKSDSARLVVTCGNKGQTKKCPYRFWASWMGTERSFQIKELCDMHKCTKNFNNSSLMTPTWIARQFLKELIRKPNLKCSDMQAIIKGKFYCDVSWTRCYRARMRAMTLIEGKLSDHYARVWDYGGELLRSNPGSQVQIGVDVNPDESTFFKRMYICFKAIADGWKRGCRRVIGLDGCFLKGQCKGELLTAIGRDANNQVYPTAWAVVDIENKANWKWFLELLHEDLELQGGIDLCIISDQHKGLVESTKEILPHVEHRQCARHIYANFRKVYNGLEFKNMFWAAAMSTVEADFLAKMDKIKAVSPHAYEHMMSRDPSTWCRAYFEVGLACEAVENGMAECFNSIILEARKKPLITMREEIKLYMMDRFWKMTQKANRWEGDVCPAAVKKMTKFGEDVRNWVVCPSGVSLFETRNGFEAYCVDLESWVCSCRLWDISGIPCVHAQASMYFTHQDPVNFISSWFSKEKHKATYAQNLLPLNGSNLWAVTPYTKPLPPVARRMPGRPSIKRRRHVSENEDIHFQVGRTRTTTCTNCQERGHNKVSCKNPTVTPEPKPKKKMGRPRMDPDVSHWTRGGHRGPRRGARGGSTRGGSSSGRGGSTRGGSSSGRGGSGGSTRSGSSSGRGCRGGKGSSGMAGSTSGMAGSSIDNEIMEGFGYEKVTLADQVLDMLDSNYTYDEVMACCGLTNDEMDAIINNKENPMPHEVVTVIKDETVTETRGAVQETDETVTAIKDEGDEETKIVMRSRVRRPSERIKMRVMKNATVSKIEID